MPPPKGPLFLLRLLRIASAIVPLALLALWGWQSWNAAHDQARATARNGVELAREHLHKVIQTQQRVLAHVDDMIAGLSWQEISDSESLQHRLRMLAGTVDALSAISLIDAGGYRRTSALDPTAAANLSDRDYFIALQGFPYPVYVGERSIGRVSGNDIIVVAQRRASREFDGVIVASIHTEALIRFFRGLVRHELTSVALIRPDGRIILRVPEQGAINPTRHTGPMRALPVGDRGAFESVGAADGVARTYAYSRVGDLPLYITYGIAESAIAGRWREQMAPGVAAAVLLSLLSVALTTLLIRQSRAETLIRARLEQDIADRTGELTRALADKDVLLREVHHRVKNNFQVVASLLRIQLRLGTDPWEGLRQSLTRIYSMGLVHQQLYQTPDLSRLDLIAYLRTLVDHLRTAQGGELRDITCEVSGGAVSITLDDAIPVALIVTEALSNAFKHAFPQGRKGHVGIHVAEEGGVLVVRVRDDGVGHAAGKRSETLGLRLIESLAGQLDASYTLESDGGTTFTLRVPRPAATRADAA